LRAPCPALSVVVSCLACSGFSEELEYARYLTHLAREAEAQWALRPSKGPANCACKTIARRTSISRLSCFSVPRKPTHPLLPTTFYHVVLIILIADRQAPLTRRGRASRRGSHKVISTVITLFSSGRCRRSLRSPRRASFRPRQGPLANGGQGCIQWRCRCSAADCRS